MKTLSAVILAAGNSTRMGKDKQQILLNRKPVWLHSVLTFGIMPQTLEIIVVTAAEHIAVMEAQLTEFCVPQEVTQKVRFAVGGKDRMASAARGVRCCQADSDYYAIHDGARPLVDEADILKALDVLGECDAVSLGVFVKDTIKQVDQNQVVVSTPDRSALMITQTPQIMKRDLYRKALEQAEKQGLSPTDDCQLIESYGVPVRMVTGSYQNIKITTPEDVPAAHAMMGLYEETDKMDIRVGHGYDVHRFAPERDLVLGGVKIPYEFGLLGHSDADVLVHAVMDALLGAAALGDIGKHFPDTDPTYKGADSIKLLERVVTLLAEQGYLISNIDTTVIAQKPKLASCIPQMRENIARTCRISPDRVNVKATTEEKLGFTGRLEGISAHAVCTLIRCQGGI